MIRYLLSNDLPRSRLLSTLLIALVITLALAPLLFPGAKALAVAAKILVFVLLVASYDLLLGYTGIVSFAHTMFFGIGAYSVAIACSRLGASWMSIGIGLVGSVAASLALALLIGLFSLRVRAIFFAMLTLAVASAFQTLASQLSEWTGGEDGLSFRTPEVLSAAAHWRDTPLQGLGFTVQADGRLLAYWGLFAIVCVAFLLLLRIVNSPFGRVLQAIRENPFRAEAIGYQTVIYRTLSVVISALFATLAGALMALWLRYNGPDTSLSFELMLDVLLVVVIGGMGTMYGAWIGSTLFLLAQNYLQALMQSLVKPLADGVATVGGTGPVADVLRWAVGLLGPDRWLLWLGVLFVLSVYHFPEGVVGRMRRF